MLIVDLEDAWSQNLTTDEIFSKWKLSQHTMV